MRKPKITILSNPSERYPFVFLVKWPGNHWKNSHWFSFNEALIAAGVKKG